MGSDPRLRPWHLVVFRIIARHLNPPKSRMSPSALAAFNQGLADAQRSGVPDLTCFDFAPYARGNVPQLRRALQVKQL
jgi:hypothetical protein